jgi:Flp pilus assembly protein TadD
MLAGPAAAQDGGGAFPASAGSNPTTEGSFGDNIKNGWNKFVQSVTPSPRAAAAPDATALATPAKPGPELYVAIGQVAEQQGKFDQAEEQYLHALKLNAKDLGALMAMARLRDRQNRFDESLQYYHQAIKTRPKEACVLNDLGLCLARRQMYPDAIAALRKAVQLQPQKPLYHNNLASVLVETGDMEGAYTQLRAVHDEPEAYYDLGYLMFLKGNRQAAAALFTKALQEKPSLKEARIFLERLGPVSPAQSQGPPRFPQPANQPGPPNPVAPPRFQDAAVQPSYPDLTAGPRYPQPPVQPQYAEPSRPPPPVDGRQNYPPSGPEIPGASSVPQLPPTMPQGDNPGPGSRAVPYMANRTTVPPGPLPPAAQGSPFGERLPGNVVPLPPVHENDLGQ